DDGDDDETAADEASADQSADDSEGDAQDAADEDASADEGADEEGTADGDIPRGGAVRHLLYEDPDTLNFVIGGTTIGRQVYQTPVEGLVYVDLDGNFQPLLAEEVPTQENGGVSEDGLTVTWKLKQGVTWHDGEPFTADDVLFTYEVATSPESI